MLSLVLPAAMVGFFLTLLTIPPIIRVSREKNLFDEPNHRKLNKVVIPNLGGVGIFIGATLSSILFFNKEVPRDMQYIFAAIVLMLFVGLKDDIIGSSPRNKLFMQFLASLVLIFLGDLKINNLYGLFFINEMPVFVAVVLTLVFCLFMINAINLVDGIDGLAAGIGFVFLSVTGYWFYESDKIAYAVLCAAFAGSLLAFLRFNLFSHKYKLFMGDTGSLILGVLISSMVILFLRKDNTFPAELHLIEKPALIMSLLVVPVTDTLRVFFMRIRAGQSPFTPDMNHIHHVLIKSGLSHKMASLLLVGWSTLMLVASVSAQRILPVTALFPIIILITWSTVEIIHRRHNRINKAHRIRLTVTKHHRKPRTSQG